MNNAIDVNCLWGSWPFRRLHKNNFGDLLSVHRETGFSLGYVACMNSIFYQDPMEGDEALHETLKGSGYRQLLTVNPMLPAWEDDVERGIKEFGIAGVRIFPSYHGYRLDDPCTAELCAKLRDFHLPLFVTMRMEDKRFDYLLLQREVGFPDEISAFLRTAKDLPVLLLSLRQGEMLCLAEDLRTMPNLYADTSCLKDSLFCMDTLTEKLGDRKLVYGSQYPLNAFRSTLFEVTMSRIPEESKNRILRENALNFFNCKF